VTLTGAGVHIDSVRYPSDVFYTVRPECPRVPAGAVVLHYEPGGIYYTSDGVTQGSGPPELVSKLADMIEDRLSIASEISAYLNPPPTIMDLREMVNALRDQVRAEVTWRGYQVDTNDTSLGKIVGRALAYSSGLRTSDSVWIMSDNSMVTLTMAEFLDMAAAVDAAVDAAYVKAGNIKALITNGTIEAPDQVSEAWNE